MTAIPEDIARPLRLAATLHTYTDRNVIVRLMCSGGGWAIEGRWYGYAADAYGAPSTILLRTDAEATVTIPWHAVAMIEQRPPE